MKKYSFLALLFVFALFSQSCKKEVEIPKPISPQNTTPPAPEYSYEIVNTWPHDRDAFTEGLEYYDGELYESTGLNGKSRLSRIELKTGKVLQKIDIDNQYFGEGITIVNGKIYQLTYQTHIGFIYDFKTFEKIGSWQYEGEGWALTNDGKELIMDNGSNKIMFLDPRTQVITRTIEVTDEGMPVEYLNELEYIKGEIYANIWMRDMVARIDPATGKVNSWINLSGLLPPDEREATEGHERPDVLNGIAYDEKADRLFVTGKLWPKIFEIKVKK